MEVCSAFQMFLVGGCCLSAKGGGESGKELGEAETLTMGLVALVVVVVGARALGARVGVVAAADADACGFCGLNFDLSVYFE